MTTIDTTGLSCPQPMLLAKKAMETQNDGTILVLADCDASKENVSRLAKQLGWTCTISQTDNDNFTLTLKKKAEL